MLGIFLIAGASALDNQGIGAEGENFTFVQTCDDATWITLSTLQFPDRTTQVINTNMTSVGGKAFQYNFSNLTIGRHDVTGISDGCSRTFATYFEVTPEGVSFSTGNAIIYGFLLFFLLVLNFFLFYVISGLTLQNERDEATGEIIQINVRKYLKIVLIGISYGLVLLTINLMNALALSVGQLTQFSGIISGLFSILLRLAWPWTIGIIVWIILVILQDSKFRKVIEERFEEARNST